MQHSLQPNTEKGILLAINAYKTDQILKVRKAAVSYDVLYIIVNKYYYCHGSTPRLPDMDVT